MGSLSPESPLFSTGTQPVAPGEAMVTEDPADALAAVDAARALLETRLRKTINALAGRRNLKVELLWTPTRAPGQPKAPAWFNPATSTVTIDTTVGLAGVDPATVNPLTPQGRREHPVIVGLAAHEAAHAQHTRWTKSFGASESAVTAAMAVLLEEPRVEAHHLRRRPQDRPYLRAQSVLLDVASLGAGSAVQGMVRSRAAEVALLVLGRVDAGVLEPEDGALVEPHLRSVLGASLDEFRGLWREAIALEDRDVKGLMGVARRWVGVLGEVPAGYVPAACGIEAAGMSPPVDDEFADVGGGAEAPVDADSDGGGGAAGAGGAGREGATAAEADAASAGSGEHGESPDDLSGDRAASSEETAPKQDPQAPQDPAADTADAEPAGGADQPPSLDSPDGSASEQPRDSTGPDSESDGTEPAQGPEGDNTGDPEATEGADTARGQGPGEGEGDESEARADSQESEGADDEGGAGAHPDEDDEDHITSEDDAPDITTEAALDLEPITDTTPQGQDHQDAESQEAESQEAESATAQEDSLDLIIQALAEMGLQAAEQGALEAAVQDSPGGSQHGSTPSKASPKTPQQKNDQEQQQKALAAAQKVFSRDKTQGPKKTAASTGTKPGSRRTKAAKTVLHQREPTLDEKHLARRLRRILEKAQLPDRATELRDMPTPPGRMRGREAMVGAAQRAQRMPVTAKPFRTRVNRFVEAPPIHLGVMVDISGSMGWATSVMTSVCWAFGSAMSRLDGRSAAVTFGHDVAAVTYADEVPKRVSQIAATGTGHHFEQGFLALDGALELVNGRGARVLVVVSDGHYGAKESNAAALAVRRLKRAGGITVWIDASGGGDIPRDAVPVIINPLNQRNISAEEISEAIIDELSVQLHRAR